MTARTGDPDPANTIAAIRDAIPPDGFFPGTGPPHLTPQPFPLPKKQVAELERLGHRLFLFHQALARIHRRSTRGKLPSWIAAHLEAGDGDARDDAGAFCPELLVTNSGWSIAKSTSPGDIAPLTLWLNRTYAPLTGDPIVAGPDWDELGSCSGDPSAPTHSGNEIAFALLHLRALHDVWRHELRESQFKRLQAAVPYTWIMDPAPLPPHAVIPRLEIKSMQAAADLPAEIRDRLTLISADRALAGRNASDAEWSDAVHRALEEAATRPHILRETVTPATIPHPVWDSDNQRAEDRATQVRLNPVYVTQAKTATLAGVLATLTTDDGARTFAPCAMT